MRHLLLSCFLLGLMSQLNAQADFELFQFNTPYVFEQPSALTSFPTPYVGVFRQAATDNQYITPAKQVLRKIEAIDPFCLYAIAPFYGDSIAAQNGITTLFNSIVGGEMMVRHADPVGANWLAYADPDSEYELWMSVESIQEETFLGITDQVKTIALSQRENAADPLVIIDPLLKISQNHGLVEGADLWRLRSNLETISLAGLVDSGYLDYYEQDFFGLSPGDELHTKEIDQVGLDYYGVIEAVYTVTSMVCDPVLGVTSILWSRKSIDYKQSVLDDASTNYDSTGIANSSGSWNYSWAGELHWLQGKVGQFWQLGPGFGELIQLVESPFETPAKRLAVTFSTGGEPGGCYEFIAENVHEFTESYYVGFAGPYYAGDGFGGYEARRLVYGNTNYGTVGTPFDCDSWTPSSVIESWSDRVLAVYPNPARNFTTITLSEAVGPVDIILMDASGRKVRQYSSVAQSQRIDFANELAAGVYQLVIRQRGQLLGRKRLVIQ
jgi:hypothetical protein